MNTSITAFLTALQASLADKETYRLDVTRNGDSLDIVVLPMLKDDSTTIPAEAQATRAALSMPLAMVGMPMPVLASEFTKRIEGFGEAREAVTDSYSELLATLKDAGANAKNETSKKSKKSPDKSSSDEKQSEPETSAATVTTPPAEATSAPSPAPTSGAGVLDF